MAKDPTFDNALAFAQDLIRIPSPSGREGDVAKRVLEEMEALGFSGPRLDRAGNVVGTIPGSGEGRTVLMNAHLDVVAAGDPSEWEVPPYEGVVRDGFLHGRGAMDIKGPLALMTYAAAALAGRATGDVVVAHTVFEERAGLGMKVLLEDGQVAPDVVVIGESTRGDICIGHRGRAEMEIVLSGVAGHASAPERARNALDLVPAALEAVGRVAADQPTDPRLGRASLVATQIDVRPETRNVIPDTAVIALDWRVLPGVTEEALIARVEGALASALPGAPGEGRPWSVRMAREHQTCYTGLAEDRTLFSPGFLMDADDPLIRAAARAVGSRDDPETPARVRPWTFATDGGWSHGVFGIPTLGFAPGEERYAHTNRERLGLDGARWAFERYPVLIEALQTG